MQTESARENINEGREEMEKKKEIKCEERIYQNCKGEKRSEENKYSKINEEKKREERKEYKIKKVGKKKEYETRKEKQRIEKERKAKKRLNEIAAAATGGNCGSLPLSLYSPPLTIVTFQTRARSTRLNDHLPSSCHSRSSTSPAGANSSVFLIPMEHIFHVFSALYEMVNGGACRLQYNAIFSTTTTTVKKKKAKLATVRIPTYFLPSYPQHKR